MKRILRSASGSDRNPSQRVADGGKRKKQYDYKKYLGYVFAFLIYIFITHPFFSFAPILGIMIYTLIMFTYLSLLLYMTKKLLIKLNVWDRPIKKNLFLALTIFLFVPLPLFIKVLYPVCTASIPPYCDRMFISRVLYTNGIALIFDLLVREPNNTSTVVIHSFFCRKSLKSSCTFYGSSVDELIAFLSGVIVMYLLSLLIAFVFSLMDSTVSHDMRSIRTTKSDNSTSRLKILFHHYFYT